MSSGINTLCFAASYSLALVLELLRLWTPLRIPRSVPWIVASAGLVAHTWYLGSRAAAVPAAPLASPQDWYLLAAWALAVFYLATSLSPRRSSFALFLLPVVLVLVAASRFAGETPLGDFQGARSWGRVHGLLLMLGTVAVLLGFVSGVMYLVQSYRLKRKISPAHALRLPSLEWLGNVNSRSLAAATLLVAGGFFTGVLSRLAQQGEQNFIPWTDPVVASLAAMLLWLVAAEVFRMVYPAARRGRKVAYLTLAAFGFLVLVLVIVTFHDTLHTMDLAPLATPAPGGS